MGRACAVVALVCLIGAAIAVHKDDAFSAMLFGFGLAVGAIGWYAVTVGGARVDNAIRGVKHEEDE